MDKLLMNVKKVLETTNNEEVNKLLENGWVLINTSSGKEHSGEAYTQYSLGWTHENSEKEYLARKEFHNKRKSL